MFYPPLNRVTDSGPDYINVDMKIQLCTLTEKRRSPRAQYSPWRQDLVEVQNENLGTKTHLRMFFKTLFKIGHIKSLCTLMQTFHFLFGMKCFSP